MCTECLWVYFCPLPLHFCWFFYSCRITKQKKRRTNVIKNQCMISLFSLPHRLTPNPVPTTETFIFRSQFLWSVIYFFLLYCSPYIVVLDWYVSYALMSVGKLHCNISSQHTTRSKQMNSLIATRRGCLKRSPRGIRKACIVGKEKTNACYSIFIVRPTILFNSQSTALQETS